MALEELLGAFEITADEFLAVVEESLLELRPGPETLTPEASSFLDAHGGLERVGPREAKRIAVRSAADNAALLVTTSITLSQAAHKLGIDEAQVRNEVADGALYACRFGDQTRLPGWQFADDGQPVPGLRAVLAALPADLHPLSVNALMTLPREELVVEDRDLSPRDWLASDGDVAAVVDVLTVLDEW